MTAPRNKGRRWIAPGLALVALAGLALVADHSPAPVLINESPSLPRGVYVRLPGAAPARDTVVAVPQPFAVRAYLGQLGMPDDLLLIKRVAAVGGDTVCRRDDRLVTPARTVVVQRRDRRGVALPTWRGCRRLGTEELFLIGDTPSSFDSRYFGPVARSRVTGVYREILTW
ncbi:MAG: S26 family signal peptidase [Brevundimonas sp.]|uniref:S26 family signal peptidase n=1 Tax=Brevundimonas sp. TaxID=1871086 RepID=UPI00271E644C|nr:S26 family signal peptidase [Brevundimonas sp.]MDO9586467.1 S26 family signal peptidase [Brevundimonas sp.]